MNKNNVGQLKDGKFYQNSKGINCLLLPGSRDAELKYILPEFISLIKNSNKELRNFNWIIPTTKLKYHYVISKIRKFNISNNTRVLILEDNYELLMNADLAVACSGTITLELVLFKVPTIAVYKTDFLSAFIGRLLVNFENVLLPNFLLGKKIVPFLFQERFNHIQISKLLVEYIETLDQKKNDFKSYSEMILNVMKYDNTKRINFSKNSSYEINKIINNYVY
jgi:lipid-A-disaccharide synthase